MTTGSVAFSNLILPDNWLFSSSSSCRHPILGVAQGGTGATDAAGERTNLGAAAKPVIVTATLTAAGWTGSAASYTQTIAIAKATAETVVEVYWPVLPLGDDRTARDQAVEDAGITICPSDQVNEILVVAQYAKPTIDIAIGTMTLR